MQFDMETGAPDKGSSSNAAQCFTAMWNEMVFLWRDEDIISDAEVEILMMPPLLSPLVPDRQRGKYEKYFNDYVAVSEQHPVFVCVEKTISLMYKFRHPEGAFDSSNLGYGTVV